jgi:hypothetical protein
MRLLFPSYSHVFVKRLLSVVILIGLPIAPASVVWEESLAGDLAGDPSLPTPLAFSPGNNIVKGRMTASAPSDIRDYLTFEIGVGESLAAIRQLFYTDESGNPGNRGFHALMTGTTSFIPAAENIANFLGSAHLDSLAPGADLLEGLGLAPTGGQGFSAPLGAGTYTYVIQQTGQNVNLYALDFEVVPEPTTLALAVVASMATLVFLRSQSSKKSTNQPSPETRT